MKKWLSRILVVLLVLIAVLYAVVRLNTPEILLSDSIPEIDSTREARVLSAFYGRDNDLPITSVLLSWKAPGNDGMPIVFSQEVDPSTLENTDFVFTTASGRKLTPSDITLNPANEEFELRTVLTVGELGDHPDDPPVFLQVVSDVLSRSGQNYRGQTVAVTPLPEGPFISYAEHFTFTVDYPYVATGRGADCPRGKTSLVVRTVWAGGVRATDGQELGDNELDAFFVTIVQESDTVQVQPSAIADLKDNDNNIDLCLSDTGIPIKVGARAGIAIDPNDDVNPATEVEVFSRW